MGQEGPREPVCFNTESTPTDTTNLQTRINARGANHRYFIVASRKDETRNGRAESSHQSTSNKFMALSGRELSKDLSAASPHSGLSKVPAVIMDGLRPSSNMLESNHRIE